MQVSEVMTPDVAIISPHTSVREAARRMDELNVGALPVCDGRRLVGIVTDRDITVRCTAAGAAPGSMRIHEIMTDDVHWCFEDDSVDEVEQEMADVQIRRMPVVDRDKNLVGIVALGDLATEHVPGTEETLRRISEPSEPDRSGTLSDSRAAENAQGRTRARGFQTDDREHLYARGRDRLRHGPRERFEEPWSPYGGENFGRASDYYGGYWREGTLGPPSADPADAYGSGGYGAGSYGRAYAGQINRQPGYESEWGSQDRLSGRSQRARAPEGAQNYRGRGPRGYVRSDERIREDLNQFMLEDVELDATNIEAEVKNCEVTLDGTVSSRYDRRRAEDIAESIPGVTHVENKLRIHQDLTTGNPTGMPGAGSEGRNPPTAI